MRCLVIALLAIMGFGCGRSPAVNASASPPPKVTAPPATDEKALYEGVRSGYFQLSGVQATLEQAVGEVTGLSTKGDANLASVVTDLREALDSAGAGIADYTDEPPPFAEFSKDFAAQDEKRIRAIDAANDALHELEDASGLVSDLLGESKYAKNASLGDLADVIQLAIDDLTEAINSLGGKVEAAPAS